MSTEQTAPIDDSSKVNKTDLARILGYAKSYITKLSKQGKITGFDSKGLIVLGEARRQLEASKDYRREAQRQAAQRTRKGDAMGFMIEAPSGHHADQHRHSEQRISVDDIYLKTLPSIPDAPGDEVAQTAIGGYFQQALCARMIFDAQLRLIEYLEASGSLVPKDNIMKNLTGIATVMKSKIEGLPKKLGPMLAGKTADQVGLLMKREGESLIHELNKQFGQICNAN